jgi:hypothetical protein
MMFWLDNPGTNYSYEKSKKNSNRQFLGSMSRSRLCEYGPKIVEKKYTVAHNIPEIITLRPEKKKKFDPSGLLLG